MKRMIRPDIAKGLRKMPQQTRCQTKDNHCRFAKILVVQELWHVGSYRDVRQLPTSVPSVEQAYHERNTGAASVDMLSPRLCPGDSRVFEIIRTGPARRVHKAHGIDQFASQEIPAGVIEQFVDLVGA